MLSKLLKRRVKTISGKSRPEKKEWESARRLERWSEAAKTNVWWLSWRQTHWVISLAFGKLNWLHGWVRPIQPRKSELPSSSSLVGELGRKRDKGDGRCWKQSGRKERCEEWGEEMGDIRRSLRHYREMRERNKISRGRMTSLKTKRAIVTLKQT